MVGNGSVKVSNYSSSSRTHGVDVKVPLRPGSVQINKHFLILKTELLESSMNPPSKRAFTVGVKGKLLLGHCAYMCFRGDEIKSFSRDCRGYASRWGDASVVLLGFEEDSECHS